MSRLDSGRVHWMSENSFPVFQCLLQNNFKHAISSPHDPQPETSPSTMSEELIQFSNRTIRTSYCISTALLPHARDLYRWTEYVLVFKRICECPKLNSAIEQNASFKLMVSTERRRDYNHITRVNYREADHESQSKHAVYCGFPGGFLHYEINPL